MFLISFQVPMDQIQKKHKDQHYCSYKDANKDVILDKTFFKLYKKFCPGPLTFIMKKNTKSKINSLVTANLNTVAIRFPSNRIVKTTLKLLNFPLAMPSANIASGVSPVSAKDVFCLLYTSPSPRD